jgi:hypothetical protein
MPGAKSQETDLQEPVPAVANNAGHGRSRRPEKILAVSDEQMGTARRLPRDFAPTGHG